MAVVEQLSGPEEPALADVAVRRDAHVPAEKVTEVTGLQAHPGRHLSANDDRRLCYTASEAVPGF